AWGLALHDAPLVTPSPTPPLQLQPIYPNSSSQGSSWLSDREGISLRWLRSRNFLRRKNGIVCEALLIKLASEAIANPWTFGIFGSYIFLADANYNFVGSLLHADAHPPHPLACFAKSHG